MAALLDRHPVHACRFPSDLHLNTTAITVLWGGWHTVKFVRINEDRIGAQHSGHNLPVLPRDRRWDDDSRIVDRQRLAVIQRSGTTKSSASASLKQFIQIRAGRFSELLATYSRRGILWGPGARGTLTTIRTGYLRIAPDRCRQMTAKKRHDGAKFERWRT